MESLTLEEKIEAFTKKMEELDSPASPASGGPGSEPSVAQEVEKEFDQDFEKGEIATMKNRLVRKGLSVDGEDPHAAAANEADELEISPEASEAGKAASLAAEHDMGKIATMKDGLASKGLDLDAATVAAGTVKALGADKDAEAAGDGSIEPTALGETQPDQGITSDKLEEPSMPQAVGGGDDDVGGSTTAQAMEQTGDSTLVSTTTSDLDNATADSAGAVGKSLANFPPPTSDDVNPTDEVENNKYESRPVVSAEASDGINPEAGSLGQKGESPEVNSSGASDIINPAAEPVEQGEGSDGGNITIGSKEQDEEAPPTVPVVASTSDTGNAMVESADRSEKLLSVSPVKVSEHPEDARPQINNTLVPDDADAAPVPIPASTQNGNASPAVAPAAMEPTSTAVPAADQKRDEDTAKRATKPSGSLEGSSAKPSKAKAVRAAVKARASPASQGSTQRQQRQHRRHSHVARSASNGARPETRGAAAGAVMDTKHSRPSEQNGAKRFVDPPARNASCVTSSAPVTPGLDVSPSAVAAGPAVQRRRSFTPVRKRASLRSHRQQGAVNPARAVEHGSPVVVTPGAAEELGTRLHEQARQSRERLQRHRKEGTTPSFSRAIASNVSPIVMTPTSAERSGNRLYEQAREAHERLERRRKDVVTSPLSPFTPRLWSNPRIGNTSVAGVERIESLYRDAILRNSKLEIARRAAERPIECTFTPELSKRATSRGKAEKREGGDFGGGEGGKVSTFDALYLDAKRRRAKMDALCGAHMKDAMVRASPVITARGRQASVVPLEARMKENAERWVRRWKELEKRKIQLEQQGCTFMPNFNVGRSISAPRMRLRRDTIGGGDVNQDGIVSFVERSYKFQMERAKKIEKLKLEAIERERAETTFRPKLLSSREGDNGGPAGIDVFERLLKAATEQEMNKVALKELLWKQERERYHDFQPQLPSRGLEGPSVPLEVRMKKSTEDWIKGRAQREQRRYEVEAEQCTFRPALGSVAGAGLRRSASLGPRLRARSPLTSSSERKAVAEADAFAVRAAALQKARGQRVEGLRKEKTKLELKRATSQPVTGKNVRADRGSGTGACALSLTRETGRLGMTEEKKQHVDEIPVSQPGAAPAGRLPRAAAVAPRKSVKRGIDMEELSARLQGLAAAEGFKEAIEDGNAEGAAAAADAVKDTPSSEQQLGKRDHVALAPNAGQTTDESKQKGGHGERGSEKEDADNGNKEEADHDKERPERETEVAAEEAEVTAVDSGSEKVDADNWNKEEADHDKEEKGGLEVEAEIAAEEAAVTAVNLVSSGNTAAVASNAHEGDERMSADAAGTQGVEVVGGAGDKKEAEYVEGKGVGPNEEDSTGNDGPQHQSADVDTEESLKAAALSSGADDSAAEEDFYCEQRDPPQPAAPEGKTDTEERERENEEDGPDNVLDLQQQPLQVGEEEKAWGKEEVGVGDEDEKKRSVEEQEERDEEEDEGHDADEDTGGGDTVEEGDEDDGHDADEDIGEGDTVEEEDEGDTEDYGGEGYAGHDMEEDMKNDYSDDDDDDDDEEFSYSNSSYAGREPTNQQVSRSLEDFDRAQREIAAKLRAL